MFTVILEMYPKQTQICHITLDILEEQLLRNVNEYEELISHLLGCVMTLLKLHMLCTTD